MSEETQVKIEDDFIIVKGPKGELKQKLHKSIKVDIDDKEARVTVANPEDKRERALWGLYRSLIKNMAVGVNEGFEKKLEIIGVGYRASVSENKLLLNLGYSHQIAYDLPSGIAAKVEGNVITINGIDKYLVGETAAQIKKMRKPEPYKGKGIKYVGEIIKRKAGKSATKGK